MPTPGRDRAGAVEVPPSAGYWPPTDALKPWQHQSWIFIRDPNFAAKATRILDLYARTYDGITLGPDEYVISSDEKTSIQARCRCHPTLAPAAACMARQLGVATGDLEIKTAGVTMLTVELDDIEHRALKILAVRRGTSMSRIVRDLIASELACLSEPDRAAAATWTPDSARAVLGIADGSDLATRDGVAAAMAAAERQATAIYGVPEIWEVLATPCAKPNDYTASWSLAEPSMSMTD